MAATTSAILRDASSIISSPSMTAPVAPPDAVMEPPAEPAPGSAEPTPSIGPSGYGVQVGAFSSADRANAEWTRLKVDAAGLLDGLEPRVVVGETDGRSIYRLQAEVRDEAQARAICGGLKSANKPCVPVLPH